MGEGGGARDEYKKIRLMGVARKNKHTQGSTKHTDVCLKVQADG